MGRRGLSFQRERFRGFARLALLTPRSAADSHSYYTEGVFDRFAVFAGIIQTILYVDFFWLYFTKVMKGKKLQVLPMNP